MDEEFPELIMKETRKIYHYNSCLLVSLVLIRNYIIYTKRAPWGIYHGDGVDIVKPVMRPLQRECSLMTHQFCCDKALHVYNLYIQ